MSHKSPCSAHPPWPGLVPGVAARPAPAPVGDLVSGEAPAVCLRVVVVRRGGEPESPGGEPGRRLHQAAVTSGEPGLGEQTQQTRSQGKHCGKRGLRWCNMLNKHYTWYLSRLLLDFDGNTKLHAWLFLTVMKSLVMMARLVCLMANWPPDRLTDHSLIPQRGRDLVNCHP